MQNFKELFTEAKNIYRNETTAKWSLPATASKFVSKVGGNIIGIGLLKKFAKANQASDFIFISLKNDYDKAKMFKDNNPNPGERLCRYVSDRTAISGEMPLCVLNADKGYMRFMENINEDPSIEDAEWSKPEKFDHLRTTY